MLSRQGGAASAVPADRDALTSAFASRPHARILLEAATEREWVARHLEALGHEVVVADPNFAPMYATWSRSVKTDKRDARALCEACHLGAYRPALELPEELLRTVEPLLQTHEDVTEQIKQLDLQIARHVEHDPQAKRLTTVPNVGPVTALTFVALVDKVERFASSAKLCSDLGLVPRGHITKAGNSRLRSLLVECAWGILRRPHPSTDALRQWALGVASRRGNA